MAALGAREAGRIKKTLEKDLAVTSLPEGRNGRQNAVVGAPKRGARTN